MLLTSNGRFIGCPKVRREEGRRRRKWRSQGRDCEKAREGGTREEGDEKWLNEDEWEKDELGRLEGRRAGEASMQECCTAALAGGSPAKVV